MDDAVLAAAALELGIPGALAVPKTPAALAAELGLVERRLRWFLRALALGQQVTRTPGDERYLATPGAPRSDARPNRLLAKLLRREAPIAFLEGLGNPEAAALAVGDRITRPELAAREVVGLLGLGYGRFLDVGCGGGAYAEAALDAAPVAQVALSDLPDVLTHASARLSRRGSRPLLVPGDIRVVPLPRAHAILAANLLHLFSDEDARRIVLRLAEVLEPGGRLLVKEPLLEENGAGPDLSVRFSLSLTLHGPGNLRPPGEIEGWLREGGLEILPRAPLTSAPESLVVVARKPTSDGPATGE